jgi:hypothetical protein
MAISFTAGASLLQAADARPAAPPAAQAAQDKQMHDALRNLKAARHSLNYANRTFKGERGRALEQTGYAIEQVYAALGNDEAKARDQARAEQEKEQGAQTAAQRGKTPDTDDKEGPHKAMRDALSQLQQAQASLEAAPHDYAGHRAKAVNFVKQAIRDIQAGLSSAG